MPRAEPASSGSASPTPPRRSGPAAWRASPQQLAWLILTCGVAACLLTVGCGVRPETPFATTPEPDLAVTTLEKPDIETIGALIQVQDAIRRGCDEAQRHPLPDGVRSVVAVIRDQHQSRGRDLDALVTVKHAPRPEVPAAHHVARLDELGRTPVATWGAAVVAFHRETQTEALRRLRDAADRSPDPDVQAFAQRQLPGVASTLAHLDRLPDDAR